MNKPALIIPGFENQTTAVRFHPNLFERITENKHQPMLQLPYCMLFGVSTSSELRIYSTDSILPLVSVKNTHYDSINDLCWFENTLIACSSDGFCSFLKVNLQDFKLSDQNISVDVNFDAMVDKVRRELEEKGNNGF